LVLSQAIPVFPKFTDHLWASPPETSEVSILLPCLLFLFSSLLPFSSFLLPSSSLPYFLIPWLYPLSLYLRRSDWQKA
jgi:hypothetical protein